MAEHLDLSAQGGSRSASVRIADTNQRAVLFQAYQLHPQQSGQSGQSSCKKNMGYDRDRVARRAGQWLQMPATPAVAPGKNRQAVRARSLPSCWAVREYGLITDHLSGKLGRSSAAVSQSVVRGEKIAREK